MAGERLPARSSLRSQLWFRWTGKCFETATSHMQNVGMHKIRAQNLDSKRALKSLLLTYSPIKKRGHDLKRFVFSLTKIKVHKVKFDEELCGRSNRQSQPLKRKVFRRKFCFLRQALCST